MNLLRPVFTCLHWIVRRSVVLLLASCLAAHAVEDSSSPALAEAVKNARTLITKNLGEVPGLAVAVAFEGKVVWSEGFGYADLEAKRPMSASTTRFRIASVSKTLTAAGLMRLVERGLVDLDAPVQQYVPDFPVKKEGVITTRLLAGHLAGIRHYRGREPFLNQPFATVQAGLAIFRDDDLVSAPGAKFNYTTYGYSLIAAVMESATHRDFLDIMQTEVFAPLGMSHTRPDRAGAVDPDRTQFYKGSQAEGFLIEDPIDSSYKWAGGGFLSTAEDLVVFGSALLQPGFLKEESLTQLFTPQQPQEGKGSYGIGWMVTKSKTGQTSYLHTGAQQGASTLLMIRPEAKVVIAILCNLSRANGKELQLMTTYFDGLKTPAPEPTKQP